MSLDLVRFWAKVDSSGGPLACWPWTGRLDEDGYGLFGVKSKRAHRVAYESGRDRVLMPWAVVRHTCDNRPCCNPLHLIGGTQEMNVADRVERGRSAAGRANGRNVLAEGQVLQIAFSPLPSRVLAAQFSVSRYTVCDIKNGRIWGWLTGLNSHRGNKNGPNEGAVKR